MTQREGAILSAHTGIMLCKTFSPVHEYIQEIMGHPVFVSEIPSLQKEIKDKSLKDFENIMRNQEESDEQK